MRSGFPERTYTIVGLLSALAVPALIAGTSTTSALGDFEKYLSYEAAALAVFATTKPRHAMFGGFAIAISWPLYANYLLISTSKTPDAAFAYIFIPLQVFLALVAGFLVRAIREFQNERSPVLCFLETLTYGALGYCSPFILLDLWNQRLMPF